MKEELTFLEVFVAVLSAALFCICTITFKAGGDNFFVILAKSGGISSGFFLVAYYCIEEEEEEEKMLEKTDDDPWIAEFEMKYGKMPSKTIYTEYPSGAVFLGSAPYFPTFDELTEEQKEKMLKINEELNNGL